LAKQITPLKKELDFDAHAFLSTTGKGRDMVYFQGKNTIYAQGDVADGLFFIQKGKVRLTVISEGGKKQFSVFWAKAICLGKVVSLVRFGACHLQPQ
jgi:CRP-like cAMP-binding protein